ncbi:hypothetical protein ACNSOL_11875 (plasmid) [Aliarcobacter lanthieri]|uniref:hypothetical protein n=1 Tax=Aliarcobacter lanthieri TaxID=1355374 RepID=UPI003AAB65DF
MINSQELETIISHLTSLLGSKVIHSNLNNDLYERILNCCKEFENKDEIFYEILKNLLKEIFDFKQSLSNEIFSDEFNKFSKKYKITQNEFKHIFEKAKNEILDAFYKKPETKKMILEIQGELPVISSRVYNISLGLVTKANGEELTLKEFSQLVGEDYETNLKILERAKELINRKLSRKIYLKRGN